MTLIFLNGATSSGKTTLARELQDRLDSPHLLTGIDDAFAMLPRHLHNHRDGFYFDRDRRQKVRLNFGEFGLATLKAHHRAVAAMAKSGIDLICDEVILTDKLRQDWMTVLAGLDVIFIGVHCSLNELQRRESARGDRVIGQAEGQIDVVHDGMAYDIQVKTTVLPAQGVADQIVREIAAIPPSSR
ncbi:chloramphenicol phosphotransferase CPT family protein [Qipengyuania sp. SS22]|uniref:chloramphenicol phosphotransferase CPT family protein n=1 Tax=Qipengyuania sp. SS22 TaxID=2979461 RepID=UPI0021E59D78|nr:chloramphenicol phosphotransferase CPT family protein [Qipengyuania sp. SS22]UYH55516.1 chloramphenicol phosphotransferase CPT family protein [Qipengyuania sp. SS22]